MDESAEQQLNQALLEKLEPLINTIESQLRDLVQGQAILQSNVVEISSELNLTQEELERAYDTFARLPHYIAKLVAMKNTIASTTALSRKLKRRADQVAIGREKQAAKVLATRAKEQAYDQVVAAVQATMSPASQIQPSGQRSGTLPPAPPSASTASTSTVAPSTALSSPEDNSPHQLMDNRQSSPMLPSRLPFPLPAKPAFPIVSTMRSSARTDSSPTSLAPRISTLLPGKVSDQSVVTSPISMTSNSTMRSDLEISIEQEGRVDRFPQVSSTQDDALIAAVGSSEVEVVRVRRKKKAASKSSASSSIASISTATSIKKSSGTKIKATKLSAQQKDEHQDETNPVTEFEQE
ncbi:hypothetical protein BGZ54_000989 [Gamsiella multidivaricata]|nr:hypothetical protein BGZ54_000989 [Gamsiella multidivaricata]